VGACVTTGPGFPSAAEITLLAMPRLRRWQGQAPRDSLLHPVWEPVTNGDPSDEAFVARCLLGAGWVGAKRRLSMLDLRVWAALCALLREQAPEAPGDDPTLANADTRTVQTTGYQLADMVYGEDGGKNYRLLRGSLIRLSGTTVVVHVVEQDPELAAQRVTDGYVAAPDGASSAVRCGDHGAR